MKQNMRIWETSKEVPPEYLKKIQGGRLGRAGFHDINPMWRNRIMTEMFGPCGTGWKTEIVKLWAKPCPNDEEMWVAQISLQYRLVNGEWSDPVFGVGSKMVTALEKGKLYSSDEAVKMAVTDAESVAMKRIGVGASVYLGELEKKAKWDSKYSNGNGGKTATPISPDQATVIYDCIKEAGADEKNFLIYFGVKSVESLPLEKYQIAVGMLMRKLENRRKKEGEFSHDYDQGHTTEIREVA